MTESVAPRAAITDSTAHQSFGLTDVLLLTMAAIWGVNFVVVKYATHIFSPVAFTGLRVGTAAAFLVAFAYARGGFALSRHDVLRLLLLGVLGNGLYQLFFVHGVARTRAGNASLIVGAAPAFIALVARARGMERVKRMTLFGIALSVIGVGLVIVGSASSSSGNQTTLVGGAVPLVVASMPSLIATNWSTVGSGGWLALLYSSVLSMGVAYFFWYRGLRVLGPTRTAVYSNLQPIVALLAAWAFLGEIPTIFQGVGAVTIIAGVFL